MTKPPYVPADIWRTCNNTQRHWVIAEHEREQAAQRIAKRIKRVKRNGGKHEQ